MRPIELPNAQPIERLVRDTDGKMLDVHSLFLTVQGEGPFSGCPAVFVRLAGCNIRCALCDTDYTTGRGGMAIGDVLLQAMNLSHGGRTLGRKVTDLIVLTGGEPFRQPIGPLVRLLLDSDFRVQIETNGTLWLDDFPWHDPKLTVVCSPKTHVHARVINAVRHWKYVIDHRHVDERTGLPTKVLGQYVPAGPGPGTVWLSPMDEGPGKEVENALNRQACVKSALAFGHRISLQSHKLLGVE